MLHAKRNVCTWLTHPPSPKNNSISHNNDIFCLFPLDVDNCRMLNFSLLVFDIKGDDKNARATSSPILSLRDQTVFASPTKICVDPVLPTSFDDDSYWAESLVYTIHINHPPCPSPTPTLSVPLTLILIPCHSLEVQARRQGQHVTWADWWRLGRVDGRRF